MSMSMEDGMKHWVHSGYRLLLTRHVRGTVRCECGSAGLRAPYDHWT